MKNVGVLYGGYSSEFDISKKSATQIFENAPDGYQFYLIEVTQAGWFVTLEDKKHEVSLDTLSFKHNQETLKIDVAHIYIHGNPGENGKIQAFLDMKNVPYINSNALSSELSFEKWYCNQFLKGLGFHVAESILLTQNEFETQKIIEALRLPIFVKPTDSGSSFGISKVKETKELSPAIDLAFKEGNTVVLESFLDGREFTCGVYETKDGIKALPVTEIISDTDFFDYAAKYDGKSREVTPAEINVDQSVKMQTEAIKAYQILQLNSIARIDFMLVDDVPYIIEVNTTPGFSKASIVPKMLACNGVTIKEFWTEIYNFILNK